jgi:hypothetical protein
LDHYTYMRKNGDTLPLKSQFTSFLRFKKASSANFECKFLRI